jgi:hypothetical protein
MCKFYHESQLTINQKLKTENEALLKQNEMIKLDLARYRTRLTIGPKPFVDLTEEDNEDSDLEIVSEIPCKKRKISCTKTADEVIEIINDDEPVAEAAQEAPAAGPAPLPVDSITITTTTTIDQPTKVEPITTTAEANIDKPASIHFAPKPENNRLINPFAMKPEELFQDLESFQNYILDQIPMY